MKRRQSVSLNHTTKFSINRLHKLIKSNHAPQFATRIDIRAEQQTKRATCFGARARRHENIFFAHPSLSRALMPACVVVVVAIDIVLYTARLCNFCAQRGSVLWSETHDRTKKTKKKKTHAHNKLQARCYQQPKYDEQRREQRRWRPRSQPTARARHSTNNKQTNKQTARLGSTRCQAATTTTLRLEIARAAQSQWAKCRSPTVKIESDSSKQVDTRKTQRSKSDRSLDS